MTFHFTSILVILATSTSTKQSLLSIELEEGSCIAECSSPHPRPAEHRPSKHKPNSDTEGQPGMPGAKVSNAEEEA
jgi:hypothetical protein